MEVAEKLFAEKGFAGTSVRDIAEAAGVNLAMISYYFGSKEKLMESMFTQRGQHMKMELENMIRNDDLEPFQKFEKLIDDYIEKIFRKQCFHKIMVREQMFSSSTQITEQIFQLKKTNQELVKQLIQEGQKKGVFKKNIDVPFLMMTLIGTCTQLLTAQHFYREINNLQALSEEEFQKHIRKKLSTYLKNLFKSVLVNEN